MAQDSKIQWTTHTFNPWRGCTKVSAGCAHCYAEATSKRNPSVLGEWGLQGKRVVAAESYWRQPIKWNRDAACQCGGGFRGQHSVYCPQADRPRVFCASLADVFEGRDTMPEDSWESVKTARSRLFRLIDETPNLDWLLVTKRPENIGEMWEENRHTYTASDNKRHTYRHNVWLGTSVEDQRRAEERIPHLLRCPAAVRFLSCEPLLGPIVFDNGWSVRGKPWVEDGEPQGISEGIDWVIIGGESGPGSRPCDLGWIREIIRQCNDAGVACFVKQLGSNAVVSQPYIAGVVNNNYRLALKDKKGGDIEEFPDDLKVREFPCVT